MAHEDLGGDGAVGTSALADRDREAPGDGAHGAPVLAEGVELIGEYEGSGFKEPPSLVRRPDGQVIQLPPLLYFVAARADGQHGYEHIAAELTAEIRREIDADQVRFLVEEKLRPLGVLAQADGSSPPTAKPDPLLGFKFRIGVISESVSSKLGSALKPLFLPPLVLAVLGAFIVADVWLFFRHGVAPAIRQSIYQPGSFLLIFTAVIASAAFHEVGHAAGCRYGGGNPGKMGCGLYLAWPAFYTDVTDAYRLGRRARLRTDLGGVYFNVIVVVATVGLYHLTGFEPLLLLVVIQHFEIAHQLLPVVRLDGYYIVADLTGVPDLFSRIGPILRSMLPGRPADPRVVVLKRWVRVAVTAWVLVVVPLLLFELLVLLIHLPRMLGTAWDSAEQLFGSVSDAAGRGDALGAVSGVLQLLILAIPVAGVLLILGRSARQLVRSVKRRTEGRPAWRAAAVAAAGVGVVLLLLAWIPRDNYEPIGRGERGTFAEGVGAVRTLPGGSGPRYSRFAVTQRGEPVQKGVREGGDAPPAGASTPDSSAPGAGAEQVNTAPSAATGPNQATTPSSVLGQGARSTTTRPTDTTLAGSRVGGLGASSSTTRTTTAASSTIVSSTTSEVTTSTEGTWDSTTSTSSTSTPTTSSTSTSTTSSTSSTTTTMP